MPDDLFHGETVTIKTAYTERLTYEQARLIVLRATPAQGSHMLCFILGYLKNCPKDGWSALEEAIRAEGLWPDAEDADSRGQMDA